MSNSSLPKFRLSLMVLLGLIIPSGTTAIYLANQPHPTAAQLQVIETSLKICYGSSTALFGLLAAHRPALNQGQSGDHPDP